MKNLAIFAVLFSLVACSIPHEPVIERQLAEEVYVRSGLQKQMSDIVPALLAGYKNNYSKMTRHTDRDKMIYQRIEQILNNSFQPHAIRKIVVDALEREMTQRDAEKVLRWLSSPLGQKITTLETKASSQKGIEETEKYLETIKNRKFPAERIHLVKELSSSMNIIETTVEMTLVSQFALSMTTQQTKAELSTDDIKKRYKGYKRNTSKLERMIKYQVYGSLLYTYQSLSDKELKEYVSFAKSESGQNYTRITSSSIILAITDSSFRFARAISRL